MGPRWRWMSSPRVHGQTAVALHVRELMDAQARVTGGEAPPPGFLWAHKAARVCRRLSQQRAAVMAGLAHAGGHGWLEFRGPR